MCTFARHKNGCTRCTTNVNVNAELACNSFLDHIEIFLLDLDNIWGYFSFIYYYYLFILRTHARKYIVAWAFYCKFWTHAQLKATWKSLCQISALCLIFCYILLVHFHNHSPRAISNDLCTADFSSSLRLQERPPQYGRMWISGWGLHLQVFMLMAAW